MLLLTKFRKVPIALMLTVLVLTVALVSCDKRKALDTDSLQSSDVSDILISLNPTQIHLSSPDAVDTVLITVAVYDDVGVGMDSVRVSLTRTPSIGYLSSAGWTDSLGIATARFITSPGQYGTVSIKASAGEKERTSVLYITGPSEYSLNLTYWPPVPKLIDHEGLPYTITASLVDTTQRGVSQHPVSFAILNRVGRLSFSDTTITIPRTNTDGEANVLFSNTRTDESNNPVEAVIQAVTSSPTDSTQPIVASISIPLRSVDNSLTLEATPGTIFADGSDSSVVRAILLDTDGHGISGDTIRFRNQPFDGSIQAVGVSNENGIATVAFKPFPNHIGQTNIIAEYKLQTIHEAADTVSLAIMPIRTIGFITVSLQKQNVIANGEDSSAIFITVQDSTGGLIADGTVIFLEHTGTGLLSPTQAQTTDGQGYARIIAPANIVGAPKVDSIFVRGYAGDSTVIADTAVVHYIAGGVNQLQFIRPESTVTMIAGSGATDTVQVYAIDENGNPVANGTQIRFINDLPTSSLTPPSAGTVDGIATTVYLVGSETGDDNVQAFVPNPTTPTDTIFAAQPVVFRCLSAEATTLELSASQSNIEVGGASCQVIATLQDAYGNPLSEGYVVAFQITVASGARGTPQWPSFDTEYGVYYDTVATNINGRAVLQLYSGTKSGAVSIKACTIPLPPDSLYVCNEKSLITISSGPPAFVAVSVNPGGEASNPNTPERYVQVGAGVWDVYSNPVQYGTAVYFSLDPNNIAEVEGNSYTGGARSYHPDSVNGWAFSRIIFGCFATFDTLQVIASSAGDSGEVADTSGSFALPAYAPVISLSADPGNLWCAGPNCNQTDTSLITALLTDGGGCAIQYGKIIFSALVRGFIIAPSQVYTDENGIAEALYYIRGCDIPTPPDGVPLIETGVRAILFGYPDVEAEVTLVCTRPQ